jgi:HemY protein
MAKSLRFEPAVTHAYVLGLVKFGETQTAEELIRQVLKSRWCKDLVSLYGKLPFAVLNKQYVIVGAWLKHYGPHPEVYLTLGRLCVQGQLWGKAKDYFEKCLELAPNCEASYELGKLYEQLGEHELAREAYQTGLSALI